MILASALWTVTAYCTGTITRAGTTPVPGFTMASDPRVLPLGSIVEIEGLGRRMAHDTGRLVVGRTLDVYVKDCKAAKRWGRQQRRVLVLHVGGEG